MTEADIFLLVTPHLSCRIPPSRALYSRSGLEPAGASWLVLWFLSLNPPLFEQVLPILGSVTPLSALVFLETTPPRCPPFRTHPFALKVLVYLSGTGFAMLCGQPLFPSSSCSPVPSGYGEPLLSYFVLRIFGLASPVYCSESGGIHSSFFSPSSTSAFPMFFLFLAILLDTLSSFFLHSRN